MTRSYVPSDDEKRVRSTRTFYSIGEVLIWREQQERRTHHADP